MLTVDLRKADLEASAGPAALEDLESSMTREIARVAKLEEGQQVEESNEWRNLRLELDQAAVANLVNLIVGRHSDSAPEAAEFEMNSADPEAAVTADNAAAVVVILIHNRFLHLRLVDQRSLV